MSPSQYLKYDIGLPSTFAKSVTWILVIAIIAFALYLLFQMFKDSICPKCPPCVQRFASKYIVPAGQAGQQSTRNDVQDTQPFLTSDDD